MNQIAAHFQDGHVVKGHTNDFLPAKDSFHLEPMDGPAGGKPVEVRVAELKALFFVKNFTGDPQHTRVRSSTQASRRPEGRYVSFSKMARSWWERHKGTRQGAPGFS